MNELTNLLEIGEEVLDVEEEAFLLFAQDVASNNLGMIDPRAPSIELSINDTEYTIHQSPSLLSSHRAGGTTGAVLWKITPLFAEWITNPKNPLWTNFLTKSSTIIELGTGISALLALTLAPHIHHYIATDQEYVRKLFRTNLDANTAPSASTSTSTKKKKSKPAPVPRPKASNISFTTLDWETDQASELKEECMVSSPGEEEEGEEEEDKGFDLLLSCDCIYNEALVAPFVRTCAEICRLRPVYGDGEGKRRPTVCVIAQQQRSPDVFEAWLRETMRYFRVWRVSDEVLGERLRGGSGYLVHLLLVK